MDQKQHDCLRNHYMLIKSVATKEDSISKAASLFAPGYYCAYCAVLNLMKLFIHLWYSYLYGWLTFTTVLDYLGFLFFLFFFFFSFFLFWFIYLFFPYFKFIRPQESIIQTQNSIIQKQNTLKYKYKTRFKPWVNLKRFSARPKELEKT